MAKKIKNVQGEIVKYNNELSELPLRSFTAGELDIFMTLCAECKDKNSDEIRIPFAQIKKLSGFSQTNRIARTEEEIKAEMERNEIIRPQSFVGALKLTNKKLLNLNMELHSEDAPGVSVQFNLFTTFITDERNNELRVKVNEDFSYILNELSSEFTQFELAEFVALRSSYAKGAYRQMKRFKDTGLWYIPIEKFKIILDVPATYKARDIEARVIDKIISELSPIFKNLAVEKIYGMKTGRGRTSIIAYKFTWEPIKDPALAEELKDAIIEVSPEGVKTIKCPVCGEDLVEKEINGSLSWCHPDNYINNLKDGGTRCTRIFNDMAEIHKLFEEQEEREARLSEEGLSEAESAERKKNLDRLYGITSGLFNPVDPIAAYELREKIKKDVPDWQLLEYNCTEDLKEGNSSRYEKDLKAFEDALEAKGYDRALAAKLFLNNK